MRPPNIQSKKATTDPSGTGQPEKQTSHSRRVQDVSGFDRAPGNDRYRTPAEMGYPMAAGNAVKSRKIYMQTMRDQCAVLTAQKRGATVEGNVGESSQMCGCRVVMDGACDRVRCSMSLDPRCQTASWASPCLREVYETLAYRAWTGYCRRPDGDSACPSSDFASSTSR